MSANRCSTVSPSILPHRRVVMLPTILKMDVLRSPVGNGAAWLENTMSTNALLTRSFLAFL